MPVARACGIANTLMAINRSGPERAALRGGCPFPASRIGFAEVGHWATELR
jgi:hypothetical protein